MVDKLCIDSGGSKLSYRLLRNDEVVFESLVYQNGNIFTNEENIINIYRQIILKCVTRPTLLLIGAAGAISAKENLSKISKELIEIENIQQVEIISDVELIAIANQINKNSLLFALGTGSVGVLSLKSKRQIIGGYGYMYGDQGSGFSYGQKIIKQYYIDYDLGNEFRYMKKIEDYFGCSSPREISKILNANPIHLTAKLTKEFIDDPVFSDFTEEFSDELIKYILKFRVHYRLFDIRVFGSLTKSQNIRATLLKNDIQLATKSSLDALYNYKFKEIKC